jgi:hypothetical protein
VPLNWDCKNCAEPVPANETESTEREYLILSSLTLDLGEITEANVDEWYFRLKFREMIGRAIPTTSQSMRMNVIKRWIGLRTNVTTISRKKWINKVIDHITHDVNDMICMEKREELHQDNDKYVDK